MSDPHPGRLPEKEDKRTFLQKVAEFIHPGPDSRAELIETDALIGALNRGRPGLAAVDVFEAEPILQGHALLRLENCICTPHIGYVEQDSYEMYFSAAFDNVINYIKGTPSNIVNPGALQVRR